LNRLINTRMSSTCLFLSYCVSHVSVKPEDVHRVCQCNPKILAN